MTFAGAASATEVISVVGTAVVTRRLVPRPMGATASWKGCRRTAEPDRVVPRRDVVQCLSCMRRKAPVQFLGEGVRATSPPYPTEERRCRR